MSKSDHNKNQRPGDVEKLMADVAADASNDLLKQLRDPGRKLIAAMLRDRKRKATDPNHGVIEFDSSLMPLPEGVRPAAVDSRRLVYRLNNCRIDFSLYPLSTEGWEIMGQIVTDDDTILDNIKVVAKQGRTARTARANQFMLFRIPQLESGNVKITVLSDKQTLGSIDLEI